MLYHPVLRWRVGSWRNRPLLASPCATEVGLGALVMGLVGIPYLLVLQDLLKLHDLAGLWNTRTLKLLGASLVLAVGTTGAALVLSLGVLLLLGLAHSPWLRWLLLAGLGMTFCLSPVVHLAAWQVLTTGIRLPPLLNAVIVLAWSYFPLAVALLLLGLQPLDSPGLDSGRLLSEPYGVIRYLVLPRWVPAWVAAAALVFLLTISQSEVPALVGYPVYAEEFLARIVLEQNAAAAVVLALPLFGAILLVLPVLLKLQPGLLTLGWKQGGLPVLANLLPSHGGWDSVLIGLLALLATPLLILLWWADFTGFFAAHGQALTTSLTLGLLSVSLAVVLAQLLADLLTAVNAPVQTLLLIFLLLQILLPGPLLAIGVIELTHRPGWGWLKQGDTLLILTHSLRILPWLVLVLTGLRGAHSQAGQDAWRLLGVSWCNRQRYLRLPQEWPNLILAAGLGLALALSELATTVLVVAPGTETAVLRLYNLMHYGDWRSVTALALAQAVLVILSVLAAVWFMGWRRDPH